MTTKTKRKPLINYYFYLEPLISNYIFSWRGKPIMQIHREELSKRYSIEIKELPND